MGRREATQLQLRRATRDRVLSAIIALGVIMTVAFWLMWTVHPAHAARYEQCNDGTCISQHIPDSANVLGPKIIQVPQDNSEEAQAREREWLKVCAPTFSRDKFGVTRYVYEKSGCEYGSPE